MANRGTGDEILSILFGFLIIAVFIALLLIAGYFLPR